MEHRFPQGVARIGLARAGLWALSGWFGRRVWPLIDGPLMRASVSRYLKRGPEGVSLGEPGWYPDPYRSDWERWWTGERWTRDIRPPRRAR